MPEYCGVISVNPKTHAKRNRVEYEEQQFDMAVLERALENAKLVPIDRVIDELGQDCARSKKSAKRWRARS